MKRKLNPLPLSLREKKRYLLFSMNKVENFENIINSYVRSFFGTYFMAQMEFRILKSAEKKKRIYFVVKASRDEFEKIIAALELFKKSNEIMLDIKLEKVSGTIKTINDVLLGE